MEIGALAIQIAERRGRVAMLHREDPNQDTTIALIVLLNDSIAADDLTADEVDAAIELAKAGRLLRSSRHLAAALESYREIHFATA